MEFRAHSAPARCGLSGTESSCGSVSAVLGSRRRRFGGPREMRSMSCRFPRRCAPDQTRARRPETRAVFAGEWTWSFRAEFVRLRSKLNDASATTSGGFPVVHAGVVTGRGEQPWR